MEIWLDTIDYDVIEDAAKTGIIAGVTTNPSILSQTENVALTLHTLLHIQPGPIAVQVTSTDPEGMIEEGLRIFEFSSRMIVKVPVNRNGLIAIKQLRQEKVPVMGTGLLFSTQALVASNLGASYIAPYFSHMGPSEEAIAALKTIDDILRINASSTKILVASLKQMEHLMYCATLGVAAATIKPDLYHQLMKDHPAVDNFSKKFLSDWTHMHGQISIIEALSPTNRPIFKD